MSRIILDFIMIIVTIMWIGQIESRPDVNAPSFCLIKNIEYPDEFLYSSKELDISDNYKRKVFTNPANEYFMKSFDQMGWIFLPVNGTNDTFNLLNAKYYEHLCASDNHLEIFNYRRKVNTYRLNNDNLKKNKKCMWKLELTSKGINRFIIRNVHFKQPLYAASDLLKTAKSKRRNVYTWYKNPDSRQFIWYIYCFEEKMYA